MSITKAKQNDKNNMTQKATKAEIKTVNDFLLLINSEKISNRLRSDILATLNNTFREVAELKKFLEDNKG